MGETILGFVLVAAILIFSALITQGFARSMYKPLSGVWEHSTPKGESIAEIAVKQWVPETIHIKSVLPVEN